MRLRIEEAGAAHFKCERKLLACPNRIGGGNAGNKRVRSAGQVDVGLRTHRLDHVHHGFDGLLQQRFAGPGRASLADKFLNQDRICIATLFRQTCPGRIDF